MNPSRRLVAIAPSTESRLRKLFEREDELRAELALVEFEQRDARNQYAAEHGLLVRPGLRALRDVLR